MNTLDSIHRFLKVVSNWAVWLAGLALLLCAFMVTVDVFFRKYLNMTMSGSDEISGYVFAASTTWAYSYCLLNRSNVRIDEVVALTATSVSRCFKQSINALELPAAPRWRPHDNNLRCSLLR